jgi:hypothetical protein
MDHYFKRWSSNRISHFPNLKVLWAIINYFAKKNKLIFSFLLLFFYCYHIICTLFFIVKFVRHIVQLSNFFYYLDQFISGELLHLLIYFFDKIYIYFLYFEKKDIIIFEQKIKILFWFWIPTLLCKSVAQVEE